MGEKTKNEAVRQAALYLEALCEREGIRSVTLDVRADGRWELRAEDVCGFHRWTERGDNR